MLKEWLIAEALLERRAQAEAGGGGVDEEPVVLQAAYPILVGRPHPAGHPDYPGMGSFFLVQGGGGQYSDRPSAASNAAAVRCLRERAGVPAEELAGLEGRGIGAVVRGMTDVQGCQVRGRGGAPDMSRGVTGSRHLLRPGFAHRSK